MLAPVPLRPERVKETFVAPDEPVLAVPAREYYMFDRTPETLLMRHPTEQGCTVFMIPWKGPAPAGQGTGFDDDRRLGPLAALDAVGALAGLAKVHGAGCCLGATAAALGNCVLQP